ncbi:MAG TPA: MYXO-CTERM sorting domain-containing protein [Phycisphaerales bacterium]|nr:MYXO-CTERM sorting domain-containing protein [Phycisphaerales bacterium]
MRRGSRQRLSPDGEWKVLDVGFTSAYAIGVVPTPPTMCLALLSAGGWAVRRRRGG